MVFSSFHVLIGMPSFVQSQVFCQFFIGLLNFFNWSVMMRCSEYNPFVRQKNCKSSPPLSQRPTYSFSSECVSTDSAQFVKRVSFHGWTTLESLEKVNWPSMCHYCWALHSAPLRDISIFLPLHTVWITLAFHFLVSLELESAKPTLLFSKTILAIFCGHRNFRIVVSISICNKANCDFDWDNIQL